MNALSPMDLSRRKLLTLISVLPVAVAALPTMSPLSPLAGQSVPDMLPTSSPTPVVVSF